MTRQDFIAQLVEELKQHDINVSNKTADIMIKSFVNVITKTVASNEKLAINGFGTFEPAFRAARVGRNPANGEALDVPAKYVPKFKAASAFKTLVNDSLQQ